MIVHKKRFAKNFTKKVSSDLFYKFFEKDALELEAIKQRALTLTETNCAWYEYALKEVFYSMANHVLEFKKKNIV